MYNREQQWPQPRRRVRACSSSPGRETGFDNGAELAQPGSRKNSRRTISQWAPARVKEKGRRMRSISSLLQLVLQEPVDGLRKRVADDQRVAFVLQLAELDRQTG